MCATERHYKVLGQKSTGTCNIPNNQTTKTLFYNIIKCSQTRTFPFLRSPDKIVAFLFFHFLYSQEECQEGCKLVIRSDNNYSLYILFFNLKLVQHIYRHIQWHGSSSGTLTPNTQEKYQSNQSFLKMWIYMYSKVLKKHMSQVFTINFDLSFAQWVSEWVIKFHGISGDSRQRGPYIPYKPCNNSLYIGITIFPHTDNTQSTGHN